MEIENRRKRIFISGIDTKLGFHLVEKLRDDHLRLQNYSYIIGSRSPIGSSSHLHESVYGTFDYTKEPVLLGKYVLDCDIIVLDIREASEEAEFIIKLLKTRVKKQDTSKRSSLQQEINKKIYVIGIGSWMTWAHEKPNTLKFETNDKEQALSKLLSFDCRKEDKIRDSDRSKRIPHHCWSRERQIEQSILNLNKSASIKSRVITPGLLYGKDFPSLELEDWLARCYSVAENVWIYGQGNNLLPTVHIEDFCEHFEITLNELTRGSDKLPQTLISVDQNVHTQLEIVENLLKNSGYVKQIAKHPLVYLTKNQALYSHSVPLQKSSSFGAYQSISKSFCSYFENFEDEILQNLSFEQSHYILYGQELQPQICQQLDSRLSSVIQVFRQTDITATLSQQNQSPKQQIDIHQISKTIQEHFLKPHHRQSYVLILNQVLLDVEVVKKYNLKKLQYETDAPKLLAHKFQQYSRIGQEGLDGQEPKKFSPSFIPQISLKIESNRIQQQVGKYESRISEKEKKFAIKVDQYLLDNVIGYVSQAFFQIKKERKSQLSDFIVALKRIYDRQISQEPQLGFNDS